MYLFEMTFDEKSEVVVYQQWLGEIVRAVLSWISSVDTRPIFKHQGNGVVWKL